METEITVQVLDNIESIKEKLNSQGYKIVEDYTIVDFYFSKYPISKLKSFSYKKLIKNSFLLRKISGDSEKFVICYKDKQIKNNKVINETKISVNTSDFEQTIKIFEMANLTMWCKIENHSLVFKKDKICFAVQIIKDLGIFIEYEEDDTMKNFSCKQKIEYMKNLVKSLNLTLQEDFSAKKVYMLFKKQN